jgi:transcriptional regulator with XRE-family HTH domain
MELRHRVLVTRRDKKMSQEDLARAVGISVNTLARFERGEIGDIKAQVLGKMADVLGVTTDYLLGRTHEERQPADQAAPAPLPTTRPRRRTAASVG